MSVASIDPATFTGLIAFVVGAAVLATAAVVAIQGGLLGPRLTARFIKTGTRGL